MLIRLWVLDEAVLTCRCTHNLCFEQKFEKFKNIHLEDFNFYISQIHCILHGHVFVMICLVVFPVGATRVFYPHPVQCIVPILWRMDHSDIKHTVDCIPYKKVKSLVHNEFQIFLTLVQKNVIRTAIYLNSGVLIVQMFYVAEKM